MNFNNTFNKYIKKSIYSGLDRHPIPSQKIYNYFIIIPVFNEYDYLLKTLMSINKQKNSLLNNTLIVLVINNSVNAERSVKKNNESTNQLIKSYQFNFEYVVLDYYSTGYELPNKKAGVGIARKIGMDYCLKYSLENSLLFSLDADTLISKNYLSHIIEYYNQTNFNTCIVKFSHQKSSNPKIEHAIRLYEKTLYSIADNIKKCKSPYGYVSMGSTIICKVKAYIAVGGMPKKTAAEDFYFMQALAKYDSVCFIDDYLVYPSSRLEMRVYLGTGFRLLQYNENKKFIDLNFSENCFMILKKIIEFVDNHYKASYDFFLKELNKNFDDKICNFLYQHDIKKIWNKINNNAKSKKQFMIFFHQWFDALKVMQLLKFLNNNNI